MFDLIVAQAQREAAREAQRQNAARLAFSLHRGETRGIGDFRVPQPVVFSVVFLEAPAVASGLAVVDQAPTGWHTPRGGATVWKWERNLKGHYTGAYLAFWVQVEPATEANRLVQPPALTVQHHIWFAGEAYKDLGPEVATQAQLLTSRPAGIGG